MDDREKAMLYEEFMASFCQCGSVTSEWYTDDGKLVTPLPYRIKTRKCPGCAMIEVKQKELSEEKGTEGVALYLERT